MPLTTSVLNSVATQQPAVAWAVITDLLQEAFAAPVHTRWAEGDVVQVDRALAELDNVLSGSAWDLWSYFDSSVSKVSQGITDFWNETSGGKAVLILDGLSLREMPWIVEGAQTRGYKLHRNEVRAAELPGETTAFARSLGFSQRSALENNEAGAAHKLTGAFTSSSNLPWRDCIEMIGSDECVVFWHHWPDERMHDLSGPGMGLRKLAKETHAALTSDDFWSLVARLANGRKLVITSDHGYAACGEFHDLTGEQARYMKEVFKSQRFAERSEIVGAWVPPIDLTLDSAHGSHKYVLGRRKWKSNAGYPTLQHGGLSLLELIVPFLELTK